ncbi:DUF5050 domain-containing protein [Peribacillus sp. SCS-26]|uniref:DUF5050 domain-containing protein n=1 Tax=Paraperibacillus marinus TaxID=3115295 RepID=UPI00390662C8
MKKKRTLGSLIIAISLLLAASIALGFSGQGDEYRFFVGLGEKFDISPDDKNLLFSYYSGGDEAIYESDTDGKKVRKLVDSEDDRLRAPKYSHDGKHFLFLAADSEGIQSLHMAGRDGNGEKVLTDKDTHVSQAIFSADGNSIYYTAIAAEDFKKAEGETKEGLDLYSIGIDGKGKKQLTDRDYFSMNTLALSEDGKELYYSLYNGSRETITAYSIERGTEKSAEGSAKLPAESFAIQVSPDNSQIAYTTISEESRNSSLYEYELHILDKETGETERMTNLRKSVTSPLFFHNGSRIAFLEYENWSATPEKYKFYIQDIDSKKLESISFSVPSGKPFNGVLYMMSSLVDGRALTILYTILLCLTATYCSFFYPHRRYLPAKAGLALAVAGIAVSIGAAVTGNPWMGIALGMLGAALLGASVVAFLYTFILTRWRRPGY